MAPPQRTRKVKIPISVRVHGGRVDIERLTDHIADLTSRQIGRAADVLDKGGEYRATLRPIEVKFTGTPPSDEDRAEIERAVGRGLVRATWDAHQARRGPHSRKPGVAEVHKRVKGAKSGAKAKKKKGKGAKGAAAKRPINTWHIFDRVGSRAFDDALIMALSERFAGSQVPLTYGVLFRLEKDTGVHLLITTNRKWVADHTLTDVNFSEAKPRTEAARIDPGSGEYRLEEEPLSGGLKAWRDLAYKRAETQKGSRKSKDPDEPKDIAKPKQSAKPEDSRGVGTVTHHADIAQPARDLAADARAAVDEYTRDWSNTILVYYWLRGGGLKRLLPFVKTQSPDLPIVSRIEVVALVDEVDAEDADEAAEELTDGTVSGRGLVPKEGGGGEGAGAGGNGFDITAPPGQDVGKGGPGIVITSSESYKEGASIYPGGLPDPDAKPVEITCEPYEDEPSVWELVGERGRGAQAMEPLIALIAKRLEMAPCQWPAHFCIMASKMVAVRASQVQSRFREDDKGFIEELVVGATDESGGFVFRPLPSVGIQYLQRLAEVVPKIRELMELVSAYTLPITTKRYAAWGSHWVDRVLDEIFPACALIWYFANQFLMHQLLNTSRDAVEHRLANFDNYVKTFRVLCKTQLADQAEMIMLRSALAEFEGIAGKSKGEDAYEAVRLHHMVLLALQRNPDSRQILLLYGHGLDADLVLRLRDETEYVFGRGSQKKTVGTGQIFQNDAGAWMIRASDGTPYTKETLDKFIMVRQQVIVSIDPLISQLLHRFVSVVRPLVENPDEEAIPRFLRQLFADMLGKNKEVRQKNLADMTYAFEHGQIHKVSDDPKAPPAMRIPSVRGGRWVLEGVHALAHSTVGVWFKDDLFYVNAIDRLLAHEHAWRSFAEDMIFIFGIALSVICPPVGAAFGLIAGITLGVVQYQHAKEQETVYGALINPDQVLDYAEIQIELFMAKLTIGLSFLAVIPEGVAAVKGVSAASKRAIQRGLGTGAKAIAKQIIGEELDRLAEMCAANFVKGILIELVSETIENKVVDILLSPIVDGLIAELEKELQDENPL